MKNISYKKIKSWLFRNNLELSKRWWHRLIKVVFLSLFFLIAVVSYIAVIYDPDIELLSKHNISIKNTLDQFTENYSGEDYENTIPKFFEQKGKFGILIDNKVEYVSSYSLGKSICVKEPEKHLDALSKVMYTNFPKILGKSFSQQQTLEWFTEEIRKSFYQDTSRKCYLFDRDEYDENLIDTKNLSQKIINYRPNVFFYIEATILVPLIALISFILFALIYYRLILYIVYGNKK